MDIITKITDHQLKNAKTLAFMRAFNLLIRFHASSLDFKLAKFANYPFNDLQYLRDHVGAIRFSI